MRPTIFSGMLVQAVSPSAARAWDLESGAAGRQVDALIRSLEGHFDRETAGPLQAALVRNRDRLANIRSSVLLRMAIDELAIQAGDLGLVEGSVEVRVAA